MDREIQNALNEHAKLINNLTAQVVALSAILKNIPDKSKIDAAAVEVTIEHMTPMGPFGSNTIRPTAVAYSKNIL